MSKALIVFNLVMFLILCLLSYGYYDALKQIHDLQDFQQNAGLQFSLEHSRDFFDNGSITGIYRQGVFCVYTKDRSWSSVMETCSHEYAHYKHDISHFME